MTALAGIARPVMTRSGGPGLPALVLVLLPVVSAAKVALVGTLLGSDILALLLLPAILLSGRFHTRQPLLGLLLGGLAFWLLGAVVSDLVAGTSPHNMLRGWAAILFFGLTLATLSILVNGRTGRLRLLILGLGAMYLLLWALGTGQIRTGGFLDPIQWKFGTGTGTTILAFMAVSAWARPVRGPLLLLLAPVHLFLNARSLFLVSFLSALLCTLSLRIARARTRALVGAGLLALLLIGAPLAEQVYGGLTRAGTFGEAARAKYLDQTAGGAASILVGGRPELLVSFRVIADQPLLGHGSWAESLDYRILLLEMQQARGFAVRWDQLYDDLLIPGHSHLMGAWIVHGLPGGLFWLLAAGLILRALHLGLFGLGRADPVEVFVLLTGLWAILFSPFGLQSRVTAAVTLVAAGVVIERHRAAVRDREQGP